MYPPQAVWSQHSPKALAYFFSIVVAFAGASQRSDAQEDRAEDPAKETSQAATATFAGGCFWCMEPPYDKLNGVVSTTSGYTGGRVKNPTYEQVSSGRTGHIESIQVVYDPNKVDYETLLSVFWHNIDPLNAKGQFCDEGNQYRSAIFYHGEAQKRAAAISKKQIAEQLGGRVQTEIIQAGVFYPAEEKHQDYYLKNPLKYEFFRRTCGRDARLEALWGDKAGKP